MNKRKVHMIRVSGLNYDAHGHVIKDAAFFTYIGKKGGDKTKRRKLAENPNYYSDIGNIGGATIKRTYGRDFYSRIGKIGRRGPKEADGRA